MVVDHLAHLLEPSPLVASRLAREDVEVVPVVTVVRIRSVKDDASETCGLLLVVKYVGQLWPGHVDHHVLLIDETGLVAQE